MNILDLPMQQNDADAKTIREYLKALLSALWEQEESFSGKRPFGNSGWKGEVEAALVRAKVVPGQLDSGGYIETVDSAASDKLIAAAIETLN